MATRKPKAQQETIFVNHLLEAVKFVSLAQKGKGDEMATHSMIRYGNILAFDRTLAAGAKVVEQDLDCCPQTDRLRMALERCGEEHVIVQQDDTLAIRSGEFAGFVPLCDPAKLTIPVPDPSIAPLGDTFRAALKVCGTLVKDSAPTVLQSCIQLNPRSAISTNGTVIMEAWHGFDMPPVGMLIPKAFADAVVKSRGKIESFGFSDKTFTIYFEGGAWLRTNLYREKIPDITSRLSAVSTSYPFPADFFRQVAEIAKWSDDGRVYLHDFTISSHPPSIQRTGSELQIPGAVEFLQEVSYSIAAMKLIAPFATHFEDREIKGVTMFFGHNLRGAIAREAIERTPRSNERTLSSGECSHGVVWGQVCTACDDEIPF